MKMKMSKGNFLVYNFLFSIYRKKEEQNFFGQMQLELINCETLTLKEGYNESFENFQVKLNKHDRELAIAYRGDLFCFVLKSIGKLLFTSHKLIICIFYEFSLFI